MAARQRADLQRSHRNCELQENPPRKSEVDDYVRPE